MKYTMQSEAPAERTGPRPVLETGFYKCRIIHTERVEYQERFKKNENGEPALDDNGQRIRLENAGLRLVLKPLDPKFEESRIYTKLHVWSWNEDYRTKAEKRLRMIFDFCGKPMKTQDWDDEHLKGCKIGVDVEKCFRFKDNGDKVAFSEVQAWKPGPDHRRHQSLQQQAHPIPNTPAHEENAPGSNSTLDRFFSA
tara:strand:+ start:947 stop:1534 length:588 start_codon:yes stop_codon:yes gene_type:complete